MGKFHQFLKMFSAHHMIVEGCYCFTFLLKMVSDIRWFKNGHQKYFIHKKCIDYEQHGCLLTVFALDPSNSVIKSFGVFAVFLLVFLFFVVRQ